MLLASCHSGEMVRCVSKSFMVISALNLDGEQKLLSWKTIFWTENLVLENFCEGKLCFEQNILSFLFQAPPSQGGDGGDEGEVISPAARGERGEGAV